MSLSEAELLATRKYKASHREQSRIYAALYRKTHPDRRQAFKDRLNALKDAPCMDCGGRFPPECMDYDHARGEKLFNIGGRFWMKLERLMVEIAKCDLVCANCHRMRTRKRRLLTK